MARYHDTRASAFGLFWRFPGWFGMIFLVIGIGLVAGAAVVTVNAFRLSTEGIVATAEVLGKDHRVGRDSDGDRTDSYYVRFRFETPDGAVIEDERSMKRQNWEAVGIGGTVPVRYWARDPSLNEIEPGDTRMLALILGGVGLPFLLVGGGFTLSQARFARRAVRLRDHGLRLEATVVEHVATAYKVNDRRQYALKWQDARGQTGQSRATRLHNLADYPPGTRITVYADPDRPGVAVWQGDVGVPDSGDGRARRGGTDKTEPQARSRAPTVRR